MFAAAIACCFLPGLISAARGGEPPRFNEKPATISPAQQDPKGFLVHTVQSEYESGETKIKVLLPSSFEKAKRYRVLYLLPVEPRDDANFGDGMLEAKRAGLADKYGLICVLPTFSHWPWYADHPTKPEIRQESYFLKVVVPFVDRTYPTRADRDGRWLVGFSKSGWGAFSLLLRHGDLFGKAAAWDAPLMMDRAEKYGSPDIFGTQENFQFYRISALLHEQAAKLSGPTIRLIHFGYFAFRDDHEAAERRMQELGIHRLYRDGPRRAHTWSSGWLPEAVEMLVQSSGDP